MQVNKFDNEIKEKLKKYIDDFFYKKLSELNDDELKISNKSKSVSIEKNMTKNILNKDNLCVFNEAPESGLWYNWATDVGKKYCAISYSAGTTWIFNNLLPITPPIIYIFDINDVKCGKKIEPLFRLNLKTNEANGIRSLLLIEDDKSNPYCLIGTFEYPNKTRIYDVKLLKWNFIKNKLNTITTIKQDNSIRQIIRYKNKYNDLILFSTQNDTFFSAKSKLYWIKKNDIDYINKCETNYTHYIKLIYKKKCITGSIWDFFIDNDTIYISIPLVMKDPNKLSGYRILARLFYFNMNSLFFLFQIKKKVNVYNLIGNDKYPPGFNINSISTVQVITNHKSKYVYIYSLSDFLYQIAFLKNNPNSIQKIQNKLGIKFNQVDQNNLLDLILELRKILLNFDIEGTRIFKFKKSDLYKNDILISTVVGDAPYGTLNLSTTSNGYNSYTNLYTWCATSYRDDYYFGTLDLRTEIYNLLVSLIVSIFTNQNLYQFLLTLPQKQIIIITELFNPNFCIGNLENLPDKQLYFDIIKINSNHQDKITSNGFNINNGLNKNADDGVRNLNIIKHCDNNYLLVGTTCYQVDNVSKNYLIKINDN